MAEIAEFSEENKELLVKYNIKAETRTVFFVEGYKYDKLDDAVRYASSSTKREGNSGDD